MPNLTLDGTWRWLHDRWEYGTKRGDLAHVVKVKHGWEATISPRSRSHLFSTSLHRCMQAVEAFVAARHRLVREVAYR